MPQQDAQPGPFVLCGFDLFGQSFDDFRARRGCLQLVGDDRSSKLDKDQLSQR